jgi:molybdenum cofactor synthesis domain-containing protein
MTVSAKRRSFCEILVIGNEILSGKTLDTNSQWINRRITELGGTTIRKTTVLDDVSEIASATRQITRRAPRTLIVVGGLGPTYDDRTLQGLAVAVGRPLSVNKRALQMVQRHYRTIGKRAVEMTKHRIKMATLPTGAKPLTNLIGTAPGVRMKAMKTTIFALPGVPAEMKAIFNQSVEPFLRKRLGRTAYFEHSFRLHGIMESELAPVLDSATSRFPDVYVKSHPQGFERSVGSVLEIHLAARARSKRAAKRLTLNAAQFIMQQTRWMRRGLKAPST